MSVWEHKPLRGLIGSTPASSFVAFMVLLAGFTILIIFAVKYGDDKDTRSNIITLVGVLITALVNFHFMNQIRKDNKPEQ